MIMYSRYIYLHSFSHTIFHHILSQENGYSSLCCTVGPRCLPILNVIVCIYQPQTPGPFHSFLHKSIPGGSLKGKLREGCPRVCLCTVLRLVESRESGGVTEVNMVLLEALIGLGAMCSWSSDR